jgi:hypothetical protein
MVKVGVKNQWCHIFNNGGCTEAEPKGTLLGVISAKKQFVAEGCCLRVVANVCLVWQSGKTNECFCTCASP